MRVFLVIVGVIAVAFLGLMALGGGGQEPPNCSVHKENYDAESCHPWLAVMGALGEPFAPKLELPQRRFVLAVPPASAEPIAVPRSDDDVRFAKFELTRGSAASIVYECTNGKRCPRSLCLIAPEVSSPPEKCGQNDAPRQSGSLLIDSSGGTLKFVGVMGEGEVDLR